MNGSSCACKCGIDGGRARLGRSPRHHDRVEGQTGVGIGTQAIRLAIEQSRRELGFRAVCLDVRRTNARAIRCHEWCGFVIVGEGEKEDRCGENIPFYRMRLALD